MDALLSAWGEQVRNPVLVASVRCSLGDTDLWGGGGRATSGSGALPLQALVAQRSELYALVEQALADLASSRDAGGLGGYGGRLAALARVRYVERHASVADQLAALGIGERAYRDQVRRLHVELAERLQGLVAGCRSSAVLRLSAP